MKDDERGSDSSHCSTAVQPSTLPKPYYDFGGITLYHADALEVVPLLSRASGWTATAVNKDGNWTRTKRPRPRAQSVAAKQRWELLLV